MMTMHHLTYRTLHRQKSINWVSNHFRIHRIPQIWPSATINCCQNLKKWLCRKRFESNKEVECEKEGYFGRFDKSYYMEGIEKLTDRWNRCIELKREYFKKYNRFLEKNKFLFILSHQYQTP